MKSLDVNPHTGKPWTLKEKMYINDIAAQRKQSAPFPQVSATLALDTAKAGDQLVAALVAETYKQIGLMHNSKQRFMDAVQRYFPKPAPTPQKVTPGMMTPAGLAALSHFIGSQQQQPQPSPTGGLRQFNPAMQQPPPGYPPGFVSAFGAALAKGKAPQTCMCASCDVLPPLDYEDVVPVEGETTDVITGWRYWLIEKSLCGDITMLGSHRTSWIKDRLRAVCVIDRIGNAEVVSEHIMTSKCRCGIYAYKEVADVVPSWLHAAYWPRHNGVEPRYCARGRVVLFGEVLEATKGYRASEARIDYLEVPKELVGRLQKKYPDVEIVEWKEAPYGILPSDID